MLRVVAEPYAVARVLGGRMCTAADACSQCFRAWAFRGAKCCGGGRKQQIGPVLDVQADSMGVSSYGGIKSTT